MVRTGHNFCIYTETILSCNIFQPVLAGPVRSSSAPDRLAHHPLPLTAAALLSSAVGGPPWGSPVGAPARVSTDRTAFRLPLGFVSFCLFFWVENSHQKPRWLSFDFCRKLPISVEFIWRFILIPSHEANPSRAVHPTEIGNFNPKSKINQFCSG